MERLSEMVSASQEGPVHDVQWSPSGDHFVTVSGYMPAKTSLFSSKCRLLYDLGPGPYNMVRWNPQVGSPSPEGSALSPLIDV